jgi:hypothetical protein
LLKDANFNWRAEVIGRQKMSARVLFNPLTSSPAQFENYVTFGEALSYDGAFMVRPNLRMSTRNERGEPVWRSFILGFFFGFFPSFYSSLIVL